MKREIVKVCLLLICSVAVGFASDGVHADILAKTTQSWDGSILEKYPKGQPEITIMRITVPPRTDLVWHEHPVINAGVLISGKLTVVTDKSDTLYLSAGDPIVEVVNTWHYGRNEEDEP
ncbi:MAG: cupin domain-containing protein, partial [Candidatus Marinimicrobia bacterium]|nr:cupin domain-containing protein [Candidatus Neomarinimicrobiota bacterium]